MEAQGGTERKGWEGGKARERGRRERDARRGEGEGREKGSERSEGRTAKRGERSKEETLLDDGSLPVELCRPLPAPKCTLAGEARRPRGSPAGTELQAERRRLGQRGRAGSERGGGGAGGAKNGLQNHICFSCDFIKSHSSSPECVKISTFHSDTPH